jgi:hypothetical protein
VPGHEMGLVAVPPAAEPLNFDISYFNTLFSAPAPSRGQQASRFACSPYLVLVGEGTLWAGWYEAGIVPASAPELLEARARPRRQATDVIHASGPVAAYPYKSRPAPRLHGRVDLDGAEVLSRLTSISDDAVATEYAARKREDADRLLSLRPVARFERQRTRIMITSYCDINVSKARRGLLDEEEEERQRRNVDSGAASPREAFLTRKITIKGREIVTVYAAAAATPCPDRGAIEPEPDPQPIGWLFPGGPVFRLRTPAERIQPKMPARAPHVRDFGGIEDQVDHADAHSAFGDDPSPTTTGQRSIVGATTNVVSDKTARRADPLIADLYATRGATVRDLPGHHREPALGDEWPRKRDHQGTYLSLEQFRYAAKRARERLAELGCRDADDWIRKNEREQAEDAISEPEPDRTRPLPQILHPELERALAGERDPHRKRQINGLFREARAEIKRRPAYFAELVAKYQRLPRHEAFDRQAEQSGLEAQGWIVKPWRDPAIEEARKAVLDWLRAGKPKPTSTRRKQVALYTDAVAKRLNTATAPAKPVLAKNNGHLAPHPMAEAARRWDITPAAAKRLMDRLTDALLGINLEPSSVDRLWDQMLKVRSPAHRLAEALMGDAPPSFPYEPTDGWSPSAVLSFHAKLDDDVLIHGIENIAAELGRDPGKVLRSARNGTLPIAQIYGELVMLRSLVGHYQKQAKSMMPLDEIGTFSQISSANAIRERGPYFFDPATIAPPREAGQP